MKIAQIAPPWISIPPKTYGGTESIISFIVEELVMQGHDVTLFAPGDAKTSAKLVSFYPQSLVCEGVPWHAHLKAYYHLHKALQRAAEFDIVHTHLSSTNDMYIFPLMFSLATPHVTTLHSNFPFDRVGNWVGNADDLFSEWISSAPVVTVSDKARANLPYDLNIVGVVHLGVPTQHFRLFGKKREDFFAWLGRFIPEKGAHLAIQAAKEACVPLVMAGIVDAVDYFQQKIEPLIDNERIKYIGPVNIDQKIALLSRARGFLYPITWEEPGATVVLEAMALGCPVIAFARGVLPELVIHEQTGFLVHDLDQMVRYISRIKELDRRKIHMHVEHNFSIRVMTDKYLKIYAMLSNKECAVVHAEQDVSKA
jgi:glycosyltransferase involved in cell wall biosynthesis